MRIGQLFKITKTQYYYCWVRDVPGKKDKQHNLGRDKAVATKKRNELLAEAGVNVHVNGQKKPSVADMLAAYMQWHKRNRAESSHKQRISAFNTLTALFGDVPADEFTPVMLMQWVNAQYGDCGNTRHHDLIGYVQTAFNWVERQHAIPSLIKKVDKPACDQREEWLNPDQWAMLLSHCPPAVHDVVNFMLHTGARPQEVKILRKRHWQKNRFVLKASESKGGKHARTIYVPKELIPRINELLKLDNNFVFVNSRGEQWNKTAFNSASRRLKTKTGLHWFCMTVCRHSFAVERINHGTDINLIATLLGHRSTDMILQKYGHLMQQHDVLAAAVSDGR